MTRIIETTRLIAFTLIAAFVALIWVATSAPADTPPTEPLASDIEMRIDIAEQELCAAQVWPNFSQACLDWAGAAPTKGEEPTITARFDDVDHGVTVVSQSVPVSLAANATN